MGKMLLAMYALLIGKNGQISNPEKVRELSRKYGEEHKEEKEGV